MWSILRRNFQPESVSTRGGVRRNCKSEGLPDRGRQSFGVKRKNYRVILVISHSRKIWRRKKVKGQDPCAGYLSPLPKPERSKSLTLNFYYPPIDSKSQEKNSEERVKQLAGRGSLILEHPEKISWFRYGAPGVMWYDDKEVGTDDMKKEWGPTQPRETEWIPSPRKGAGVSGSAIYMPLLNFGRSCWMFTGVSYTSDVFWKSLEQNFASRSWLGIKI